MVGIDILPRTAQVGGPVSSPSPGPSPIALPENAELEAGQTYFMDDLWGARARRGSILTAPATGWSGASGVNVQKDFIRPWRYDRTAG